MASVNYSVFLPEILVHVPACSTIIATNAVRNACVEFCAESHYWNELQDIEVITAADLPFQINAPSGATVSLVHDCIVNGMSIKPLSVQKMDLTVPNWRSQTGRDVASYFQPKNNLWVPYPVPQSDVSLEVQFRVSYAPTRASTTVDDCLSQDWLEEIAAGALGRLFAMKGQPWANDQMALYYLGIFNKAKVDARIEFEKPFTRVSMTAQPRRFG